MEAMILKNKVENFLYDEASLLDNWKMDEWNALFTDDGEYFVPPLAYDGAETADPRKVMFIIDDNRETIRARTRRMLRKDAYVESPRSRIRHAVTNVRVLADKGDTVRVSANLAVYRARRGQVSLYIGEAFYTLVRYGEGFMIREKRVCLDNDLLQPQGSLAIIL